ncbi:hypothetical protein GIB67_040104 [Kingdonia uniflora]|uniref:Remorin C-terminal domain-containing protein n=1 Tax=Kingdonia uniflora TaxID=39325 RepID=A0A7J7MUY1_9MAGN|nr:hypothetical protein GIB67_040104 [Kingdonia uniflora]
MSNDQNYDDDNPVRDIYALTPPLHPIPPTTRPPPPRRDTWETSSSHGSSVSVSSENFTTLSREFNALVIAGANNHESTNTNDDGNNLRRITEDGEEINPLAIVPDNNPLDDLGQFPVASPRQNINSYVVGSSSSMVAEVTMVRVKRDEVESKISNWQTAKIAKINNRFKREDAIINGFESELVQKATTSMNKIERKLEEKRARALEKMQNEVAKAHRKAGEKRASAEAKRGTKVAKVVEIGNLMRALGKSPTKRSFF